MAGPGLILFVDMDMLDQFIKRPEGMVSYYGNNGWHFSKKAYQFATKHLTRKGADGKEEKVKPYTMDEVDELLQKHNVKLKNDNGYDKVYVATMCKSDYLGSSVADDAHLALYIKDVLDDYDGGDERVFRHWYSDQMEDGVSIPWDDIL